MSLYLPYDPYYFYLFLFNEHSIICNSHFLNFNYFYIFKKSLSQKILNFFCDAKHRQWYFMYNHFKLYADLQ